MTEHPPHAMLDEAAAGVQAGRRSVGRVAAIGWLAVVAVVGLLSPWLASGPGSLVGWAPNERPNDRNTARLAPGAWSSDPLIKRVTDALTAPSDERRARLDAAVGALPLSEIDRRRVLEQAMRNFDDSPEDCRRMVGSMLRTTAGARPFRLGTDSLGQDVLANLVHGCRVALLSGCVAAGVALSLGVAMGALMGFFGGWVDALLMRIVEVFVSVPTMFVLVLAAAVLPRSTTGLLAVIGCLSWMGVARLTRAEFMRLRDAEFVQAARAAGLPAWRVIVRHLLPSALTAALVDASFLFAGAILAEATLSFLGLGAPDQPSWGRLLAQAPGQAGDFAWWLGMFPGLCLFLTVLSCNALGESARERLGGTTRHIGW